MPEQNAPENLWLRPSDNDGWSAPIRSWGEDDAFHAVEVEFVRHDLWERHDDEVERLRAENERLRERLSDNGLNPNPCACTEIAVAEYLANRDANPAQGGDDA